MKKNIEYEDEELRLKPIFIFLLVCFVLVILISCIPLNPDFDIDAFIVTFVFMLFWCGCVFLIVCGRNLSSHRKFKKYKNRIIENGIRTKGIVIGSKKRPRVYVNGVSTKYRYIAKIQTEEGDTFETSYLLNNPDKLLDKEVTVYKVNGEYFATDFKYDYNIKEKKERKEIFKHIHSQDYIVPSKSQSIIVLILGMLFVMFLAWIISKAADNFTRIVMLPFLIAGIGVFLQGLLPLVMIDKILAVKISKRVYLIGFLLYLFGFLIVWDYFTLKNGNIALYLFSSLFWTVGIYIVIKKF